MSAEPPPNPNEAKVQRLHRRRPRYAGKYPRHFEEKYKEHDPERYSGMAAKVLASGKTPAGTHRPIMVSEILKALTPKSGEGAADCTLGYGGHAQELLERMQPGGWLLGLDADPIEILKTESRLRALGYGPKSFTTHRTNFAGLPKVLGAAEVPGVDMVLVDLGVSSMQLDDPARGFSFKHQGPLDMRLNPNRGQPASWLLAKIAPMALATILAENADEPRADLLAQALAGRRCQTTTELARAVRAVLPQIAPAEQELAVRRVFQALRIAVNDEFSALDSLLRQLPHCLNPGGRAAILTFHSGEDRRVKKAFEAGLRAGWYADCAREIVRPSSEERRANPRSAAAKLRWARRSEVLAG